MKSFIMILSFWIISMAYLNASEINTAPAGMKLVWSDEFNGETLDTNKWSYDTGALGWGNQEWQYYTDAAENSYLSNGCLTIKATKRRNIFAGYSSARINTRKSFSFLYGDIQARIKLPYGKGLWPAFWMAGTNSSLKPDGSLANWPGCGEIDIMETVGGQGGSNNMVYGTIHYDNNCGEPYPVNWTSSKNATNVSGELQDEFHVFELVWSETNLVWKVDGKVFGDEDISVDNREEFRDKNNPFFIILNLAVGGYWPQYPNKNTVFPQVMIVDWVRVYQ